MFVLTYIYAKGYEGGPGLIEGLRFRAMMGLFVLGFVSIRPLRLLESRTADRCAGVCRVGHGNDRRRRSHRRDVSPVHARTHRACRRVICEP